MKLSDKFIAQSAVAASEEKKGVDPLILDIRQLSDAADYFVIVNGTSDRHVRTIAEAVVDKLKKSNVAPHHVEGLKDSSWVLVDYGAVMVHVFHYEVRKFYNLERLWGNAKIVRQRRKHEKPHTNTRRRNARGSSR